MPLTKEQIDLLNKLDRDPDAVIEESMKEICPGLHWCHDWDSLAVCFDSPEFESCTCFPEDERPK